MEPTNPLVIYVTTDYKCRLGEHGVVLDAALYCSGSVVQVLLESLEAKSHYQPWVTYETLEAATQARKVSDAFELVGKVVTAHVNEVVKAHYYDSLANVLGYAGFENPYKQECLAIANWVAECWKAVEGKAELAEPDFMIVAEDIKALLPAF